MLRDKKGGVKKNEYDQDAFDGLKWLRTGPHTTTYYYILHVASYCCGYYIYVLILLA